MLLDLNFYVFVYYFFCVFNSESMKVGYGYENLNEWALGRWSVNF